MWNRLKAAALLGMMVLSFAAPVAADSGLIDENEIKTGSNSYKTYTADIGDVTSEAVYSASAYYPVNARVSYRGQDAKLVNILVSRNASVRKGDVIAEIICETDEIAVDELELQRRRVSGNASDRKQRLEKEKEALEKQLKNAKDETAKKKIKLLIEKKQNDIDGLVYSSNAEIREINYQISKLRSVSETTEITSPIDGKVTEISTVSPGDLITDGTYICTVRDTSVTLISVVNCDLHPGMEVGITYRGKSGTHLFDNNAGSVRGGRVVLSSELLPGKSGGTAVIVQNEPVDSDGFTVSAVTMKISSVLRIPNTAKHLESGKTYVIVVDPEGGAHKRFIKTGYTGGDYTWVVSGISEGDMVAVD